MAITRNDKEPDRGMPTPAATPEPFPSRDPTPAPQGMAAPVDGAAERWIGIEAAAAFLAVPVRTLYRLAQRGEVPAAKVGRTWRFSRALLDAHLAANAAGRTVHPADIVPGVEASPPLGGASPPVTAQPGSQDPDPIRFLAALGDLAVGLSGRRDTSSIAAHVSHGLRTIFGVDLAALIRIDGQDLVTIAVEDEADGIGVPGLRIPVDWAPTLRPLVSDGVPVVYDELQVDGADGEAPAARDLIRDLGLRSAIIVPVHESGALWGAVALASRAPRSFSAFELDRLQAVAGQVGLALANARLLSETRRWSEHLEGIEALSRELNRSRAVSEVGQAVAREIDAVIDWDGIRFYVLQPDRVTLEAVTLQARVPYYADETPELVRLRIGEGLGGHIAASRLAEIIPDVLRDPRMQDIEGTDDVDETMIVVPLVFEDEVLGVLEVSKLGLHAYEATDLRLLQIVGAQAAVALANARQVEELERRVRTDALTGLPNRALFTERVEQALARRARIGGRVAVLFLDLDGFKLINDSLGHAAGDELLSAVGDRLRRTLRVADTVARLGGDEFGVLLEDVADPVEAARAAERIAEALRAPFRLVTRLVPIRASIGVVVDAGGAGGADELLRDADVAMYRAKATARGSHAIFEPSMHLAQVERLEFEGELRVAIERGEFALRYQPIVDLPTGRLAAVEALLRWHHPVRGVISPLDFVPVAEETGQIVPIGAWVLREACRQLSRWRQERIVDESVRVSVNLSTRQLQDGAFLAEVEAALGETLLAPESLVLEITESVMLVDDSVAVEVLGALRRHGVHIALDDFGTGYSSLGYLRSLPADGIKIDRSFIEGLGAGREGAAIVEAAISFAHALDLSVTAEGIETDVQLETLRSLRCDLGQGFRFAPPLPSPDLEALLRSGTALDAPGRSTSAA
jgi:diguanylate cyclase (GGDEF)-like protein/excisionase family DNA binding protein